MWRYVLKRIAVLIPLVILVSFLVYALMDLSPGDEAYSILGENATEEQIAQIREQMGLDDPLIIRYGRYVKNVLQGDFGTSLYGQRSVMDEYMSRLPATLKLGVASIVVTVIVAIPLGIVAAIRHQSWIDVLASVTAMCGLSIPAFFLGLLLMLLFSLKLGWLPVSGNDAGIKSVILPALTTGLANAALGTRITRSSMLDAIRADYLRTARAKGVSEWNVIMKHAFGNAIIPIMTIIGSFFSILMGGNIVIETLFAWPGVGSLLITAIRGKDVTMATGCAVMTTVLTASVLLLVDILYAYVDPRVKAKYIGK